MEDDFDLQRFVDAQAPYYEQAVAELRQGEKRSHWIWFIFPQLRGLGFSSMSHRYGIGSAAEAQAYLAHPILGPRLRECTQIVLSLEHRSIHQIFGSVDAMKFRSSMTLFAHAAPGEPIFRQALDKYFAGKPDDRTVEMLA